MSEDVVTLRLRVAGLNRGIAFIEPTPFSFLDRVFNLELVWWFGVLVDMVIGLFKLVRGGILALVGFVLRMGMVGRW